MLYILGLYLTGVGRKSDPENNLILGLESDAKSIIARDSN